MQVKNFLLITAGCQLIFYNYEPRKDDSIQRCLITCDSKRALVLCFYDCMSTGRTECRNCCCTAVYPLLDYERDSSDSQSRLIPLFLVFEMPLPTSHHFSLPPRSRTTKPLCVPSAACFHFPSASWPLFTDGVLPPASVLSGLLLLGVLPPASIAILVPN